MEKEVERAKIREFVTLHRSLAKSREVLLDASGRDLPDEQGIESFLSCDQANIDRIPLISRAGVSDL
jgi:hypothetical protein